MAEDELQRLKSGRDFSLDTNVTPSVLISTGLDLEIEQSVNQTSMSSFLIFSLDHADVLIKL